MIVALYDLQLNDPDIYTLVVLELIQLFQEHYKAEGHVDNYFVRIDV